MRSYTTNKPIGEDFATDHATRQQMRVQDELQFYDSPTVKFRRTTRGITAHAKTNYSGNYGWFWNKGARKYDSTKGAAVNQVVHVSSSNAAVTTGVTISGTVYKATPGTYVCLQTVPATPTAAGQIPSLPLPTPHDPDDAANYWWLIAPAFVCIDGSSAEV